MLSPELIRLTSQAVIAAYNDEDDLPIIAPSGYTYVASVMACEGFDPASPSIAKKFAVIFAGQPGEYLVAIRGTETPDEWIADADFPTTQFPSAPGIDVAKGFLDVYDTGLCDDGVIATPSLRDSLMKFFRSVPVKSLIITGHSLGAALAALFAFDVAMTARIGVSPTIVRYAPPNVGLSNWSIAYNAAVPNDTGIANDRDVVPHLPPTELGFRPVGTLMSLVFDPDTIFHRALPMALLTNHSMSNYAWVAYNQITPFADQSGQTSWQMQSCDPATANPMGKAAAVAHLDTLAKLKALHA